MTTTAEAPQPAEAAPAPPPVAAPPKLPPGMGRRLAGLVLTQKLLVAVALLLGAIGVALSVLGPLLLGRATDLIFKGYIGSRLPDTVSRAEMLEYLRDNGRDTQAYVVEKLGVVPGQGIDAGAVRTVLVLALGLYLAHSLCQYLQGRLTVVVVQRIVFGLREQLEDKLGRLPISVFDTLPKGEVLGRMTNDIDNIQRTLQQTVNTVVTSFLSLLCLLGVMFFISPLLTLIVLLTVPVAAVVTGIISRRAQVQFAGQGAANGRLQSHVEESYTGHSLIRGFGKQDLVESEFDDRNEAMHTTGRRAQFLSGCIEPATGFVTNLNYVAVAVVGALRVTSGSLTVGDIVAFVQYSGLFGQSIAGVANVAGLLQSGLTSTARVFEVLDADEETPDPQEPVTVQEVRGRVEFERVAFSYLPDKPLIEDLSLTVEPGQTLAIVGESGSGKTTLGNLLLRFHDVTGGRILLDGTDTATMTREDLRREIGLVTQETWFFEGTVSENIAYGRPDATQAEIETAARAACFDRFVNTLPDGYETRLVPEQSQISAGEMQLLTLARVFLVGPRILVLDEATSSVDTRTELLIRRAMAKLASGRTSFIIAHRLSTIRDADLIVVMRAGRIIERGRHDELMARDGHYAKLYRMGSPPPALFRGVLTPVTDPAPPMSGNALERMDGVAAEAARGLSSTGMGGAVFPPAHERTLVPVPGPTPVPEAAPIDGLYGSMTHHLAVEMYRRHFDAGDRLCSWCRQEMPCTTRLDAVAVIEAAGENPARYDPPPMSGGAQNPTLPMRRPAPPRSPQ